VKENKGVALQNILNKQYILRPTNSQAHAPSGALEKPKINPYQKQR
jgi:hypothetical protein